MTSSNIVSAADYTKIAAGAADHRITYGDDPSQFGDLFLPTGDGPHPVVFLLHGGCWRAQYGLEPMGKMARALSDNGIAVWSLEYRRLGNGGGWPHTFLDVAHGADMLRDLAPTYQLDLNRVVVVGHSAGGHLALWSAARPQMPADSAIYTPDPLTFQSVVALAPVCDLERAVAWDICTEAADVLVGGHPRKVYANYYQGSPSALLPLGVRHITINGVLDDIVPLEYVTPFVETAKKLGDDATLIGVPDVGHFEIVMPSHPAGKTVIDTILAEFAN
ncbi:MAG: acetyl esterase/lipase [Cellvibrionaceae bacterium]|jgi:acetyl esterase/lipase